MLNKQHIFINVTLSKKKNAEFQDKPIRVPCLGIKIAQ